MTEPFPSDEIVYNTPGDCPYLPGRTSCLPLRLMREVVAPEEFDQRLAVGMRRCGPFMYLPTCPECNACEAIRLDVEEFRPSRSQRRVKRRGDRELRVVIQPPRIDERRVSLFNEHRHIQNLKEPEGSEDIDFVGYHNFLVESCSETLEFAFHLGDSLAAVLVVDLGADSVSAVYCYYGADARRLSPGVYSLLTQIEFCRDRGFRTLYLGFYVAGSSHMAYKADYLPHERLIDGRWLRFDRQDR